MQKQSFLATGKTAAATSDNCKQPLITSKNIYLRAQRQRQESQITIHKAVFLVMQVYFVKFASILENKSLGTHRKVWKPSTTVINYACVTNVRQFDVTWF